MIYVHLKEEDINFQIPPLERSPSAQPCSTVSWEQNGYYAAKEKILCCVVTILFSIDASARLELGESSRGCIWKFRTSSFQCYVDHSHTKYSLGNIDVRNWVHLLNHAVCHSWCLSRNTENRLSNPSVTPICIYHRLQNSILWSHGFAKLNQSMNWKVAKRAL